MSYCRFGTESDVYVFMCITGALECCACRLDGPQRFLSTQAMIDHLDAHRAAGHKVPDRAIARLREEAQWIDEQAAMTSPVRRRSREP